MNSPKIIPRSERYTETEVRKLIEGYDTLRHYKRTYGPRLELLVKLLDLDRGIHSLGPKTYQAVLLCGLLGLATGTAGELVGVSQQTMHNRYRHGVIEIVTFLNGGP